MTRRGTRKTAGRTPSARIMLGLAAVAPLVAGAMSVGGVASAGGTGYRSGEADKFYAFSLPKA